MFLSDPLNPSLDVVIDDLLELIDAFTSYLQSSA
jgi:hypothetical protein